MNKDVTCAKSRKLCTAALAKARAANASWGTGAAEGFERPFSGIKSRAATPNLKKIVEDALEEEEEEDAESRRGPPTQRVKRMTGIKTMIMKTTLRLGEILCFPR